LHHLQQRWQDDFDGGRIELGDDGIAGSFGGGTDPGILRGRGSLEIEVNTRAFRCNIVISMYCIYFCGTIAKRPNRGREKGSVAWVDAVRLAERFREREQKKL
jgi:hypothetical protein